MVVEELTQGGGGGQPSHLGPAAWIGIALICVVGGVLLLSQPGATSGTEARPTIPVQTFTAVPIPGPSIQPVPDDPRLSVSIGGVCSAVTDGSKSLSVSFELVNLGVNDVTLLEVKPLLPMHGLTPIGRTTSGGTCVQPGTAASGGLLSAGVSRLFTMRFRLPKECPQPQPVQASVRLRVAQMIGTTTVPVYSDLGSVKFDTCPPAG